MAWEQNLKEPILETLVRRLLRLRRLQGRDLEKPFGPHMVACATQLLDEYLKLGVFGGAKLLDYAPPKNEVPVAGAGLEPFRLARTPASPTRPLPRPFQPGAAMSKRRPPASSTEPATSRARKEGPSAASVSAASGAHPR